jgi:hypothetical protein
VRARPRLPAQGTVAEDAWVESTDPTAFIQRDSFNEGETTNGIPTGRWVDAGRLEELLRQPDEAPVHSLRADQPRRALELGDRLLRSGKRCARLREAVSGRLRLEREPGPGIPAPGARFPQPPERPFQSSPRRTASRSPSSGRSSRASSVICSDGTTGLLARLTIGRTGVRQSGP